MNPDLIEFLAAPWSEEAETLLSEAIGNNPTYTMAELKHEVETGSAFLKLVVDHNTGQPMPLGFVVVWVDPVGERELVVQSGAAFANTLSKVRHVVPALARLMVENQCIAMRVHTDAKNKPMQRALKRAGFRPAELVMRFGD